MRPPVMIKITGGVLLDDRPKVHAALKCFYRNGIALALDDRFVCPIEEGFDLTIRMPRWNRRAFRRSPVTCLSKCLDGRIWPSASAAVPV